MKIELNITSVTARFLINHLRVEVGILKAEGGALSRQHAGELEKIRTQLEEQLDISDEELWSLSLDLLRRGDKKIEVIKALRQRAPRLGLREAKEMVEKAQKAQAHIEAPASNHVCPKCGGPTSHLSDNDEWECDCPDSPFRGA